MNTFKHWFQEPYDHNETILEFIALCLAEMRDISFIKKAIEEKCPDIEIPNDVTEDDLLELARPIIGNVERDGRP